MTAPKKWTVNRIRGLKGKQKITALTAYDYMTAKLADEAGMQLLLVGDSLSMTVLGYENTLPVTMAEMLHHTRAVTRGSQHALIVGDMPFLSYQTGLDNAVANAGRFIKKAGADAVKIEGGRERVETVETLVTNGIPVMGHIGLTPQRIKAMGGYKVQGRTEAEMDRLVADAKALEEAGIFTLVLEAMPPALAAAITDSVSVPTIGIGAGPDCDGQILVVHDLLGLAGDFKPKFAKTYAPLGIEIAKAFKTYRHEVEHGDFPSDEHCY